MLLSLLISAKDLNNAIQKKGDIVIVDTRSFLEYKNCHVPGAVNIDLFQLHWFDTTKRGIKDFNRQARLLLSNIGIKKNTMVLFYDNISGMYAARGIWLLLYFSHEKVRMLDGGFQKWKKEGYSIEFKSNPLKYCEFKGKNDVEILATAQDVMRSLNNKNVVLVDARSRKEFLGYEVRAAKRGHIPSAVNIDWNRNIEKGVFKSEQKLLKIYSIIPKNSQIITYCQGGYRAAHAFVALKILGYRKVKMYLGSWGEWANKPHFPVEE